VPDGYKTGTVYKFGFGLDKNFGFIQVDDQIEKTIVYSYQIAAGIEIKAGDRVYFKQISTPRGFQAHDVRLLRDQE
jgi:cold shock CspA family protein